MFVVPLAEVSQTIAAVVVPVTIMMIPIISILTRHQRKMAELIHGNRIGMPNPEVEMLRREVAELKSLVHQQTLIIDEIAQHRNTLSVGPPATIAQSLESGRQ